MKKFFLKLWPIAFIFIIWFIFSLPFLFKSKVPFSSTYQVNNFAPFSAYHQFASPVKNAAMPDVITQIFPWKHLTIETWQQGQVPLWNPYSFSGTPHLANYQSAVLSPFNLLFFFLPFIDAWSILVLLQPLLAGLCMYLYLRSLRISKIGSLISATSFMFCGFITVWMGYATLGYAILFLPLALFAIEKYYQTSRTIFLLLLSFTIPLSFFSGHFQISLYFLIFLVTYIIYKFFETKNIRDAKCVMLYTLFGLLLAMPQILPSLEFYAQSVRSSLFQALEVIPWSYFPTLIIPDFFGNPVTRNDWFGHYAEWNGYIGVIGFILAIYALLSMRTKRVYFFFGSAIIVLLLAFPTPILHVLISLRVPYLATSAASRIIVLYSFAFAVLAGFGFDSLYKDLQKRRFRPLLILLVSFLSIFGSIWIIIVFKLFLPPDKIIIARQNLIFPTGIFLITFLPLLFFSVIKIKKTYISIILASCFLLLIAFDMLRFATKWQSFDPKNLVFPSVGVTNYFAKIAGYDRSYGNYSGDVAMYYHLPSVEGYDPLYISRYGEFVTSLNNGKVGEAYRSVVTFQKKGVYTQNALNLLNIKYIIQKASDENQPWGFPFKDYPANQFTPVYQDNTYRVYQNNSVFLHVFVVSNYKVATNPQTIIDTMFAKTTDLKKTIVLEENPKLQKSMSDIGTAKIVSYTPNAISIKTYTTSPGWLFLSDNYYPGWHAQVDETETKIFRADYTFRAVVIPAGKHTVTFYFLPKSFIVGLAIPIYWISITYLFTLLVKKKIY